MMCDSKNLEEMEKEIYLKGMNDYITIVENILKNKYSEYALFFDVLAKAQIKFEEIAEDIYEC